MKQIGVGLIGFGTVGAGVVDGLQRNRRVMAQRLGVDVVLKKIADVDITTDRGVSVDPAVLTTDAQAVISDPGIQVVVELIGGTGVAKTFVLAALNAGKAVVTANKKLLAEYGEEIFGAAERNGVDIYFGASVGGGIPIIRILREGLAGNEIQSIHGILNGTCNYILTRMENEGLPFDTILKEAQKAGYAEADPGLDIDGLDTAHKAIILASLAYGFHVPPKQVLVEGIRNLSGMDVKFAAEFGYRIKLLAVVKRDGGDVEVRVHPTLVPLGHMLASVNNVFNAAMVRGDLSGDTLYYGRGAGREPTASTVIGDIGDIARNLLAGKSRYRRGVNVANEGQLRMRPPAEIVSRYYVRLMVFDKAGSLGTLTTILGRHGVSILAATQKESPAELADAGYVPVVVLTHPAKGAEIDAALREIREAGVVNEEPVNMRMI
ncbi:MAG: homoserine dehydrogenase [Verrucomicrobiota bacterium]|jgi:homoserine dehydrogenase|nr:homoserine dehydrogenase [Verrucomicrobiota bacterium]